MVIIVYYKTRKSIFFVLIISLVIIVSSKHNEQNVPHSHKLMKESQIHEICNKSINYLQYFYISNITNFDYNPSETMKSNSLIRYIQEQKVVDLKDYFGRLLIYAIFTIILILYLIGFIICCFCYCYPCCCKQSGFMCKNIILITSICLYLFIFSLSIVSVHYINDVFQSMNGTTCSLFQIYRTVLYGDQKQSNPKWPGTIKIKEILNIIINVVENLNLHKSILVQQEIQENSNYFQELLHNSYLLFANRVLPYPEPEMNTEHFIPNYIDDYGPFEQTGKDLYYVHNEYIKLQEHNMFLNNYLELIGNIIERKEVMIEILNYSKFQVDELTKTFEALSEKILEHWLIVQNYFNIYGKIILLCINSIISLLSFFGTCFLVIYSLCNNCEKMKYIINVTWIMLSILTIIIFAIGIILGSLSVITVDLVGIVNYAFSQENLIGDVNNKTILFEKGKASEYINICINSDGDLTNAFRLNKDDPNVILLQNLYTSLGQLERNLVLLSENNLISVTKRLYNKYDEYKDNPGDVHSSFTTQLNKLNDLLNGVQFWVVKEEECIEKENCFSLKNNYSTYILVKNSYEIITIRKTLQEFLFKHIELLNDLQANNIEMENILVDIRKQLISQLGQSLDIITVMYWKISPYISNEQLFSPFNCEFLKGNVKMFYQQIENECSDTIKHFAWYLIIIGTTNSINVIFNLLVIFKFQKLKKPQTPIKKEEESIPVENASNNMNLSNCPLNESKGLDKDVLVKLKENK